MALTENLGQHAYIETIDLLTVSMVPVATPTYLKAQGNNFSDYEVSKKNLQIILKDTSRHLEKYTFGVIEGAHHWYVSDLASKKQLILSDLGWGRLPKHMITAELQSGQLIKIDKKHIQTADVTLSLLRRLNKPHGIVASQCWDVLTAKVT